MQPVADPVVDLTPVDAVLFYSRRTAEAYIALPDRPPAQHLVCLSPSIAVPLREARFGPLTVAAAPNEDAIFAALLSIAADDSKSE